MDLLKQIEQITNPKEQVDALRAIAEQRDAVIGALRVLTGDDKQVAVVLVLSKLRSIRGDEAIRMLRNTIESDTELDPDISAYKLDNMFTSEYARKCVRLLIFNKILRSQLQVDMFWKCCSEAKKKNFSEPPAVEMERLNGYIEEATNINIGTPINIKNATSVEQWKKFHERFPETQQVSGNMYSFIENVATLEEIRKREEKNN